VGLRTLLVVGTALTAACRSETEPLDTPASRPVAAATAPAISHVASEVAAARVMLASVPTGGRGAKTGYLRTSVFGPAWADVEGNGCGTRDDILGRDLTTSVRRGRCDVVSGALHDPYTGRDIALDEFHDRAIQIDHVVALSLAWQLGAAQWTQQRRLLLANDPANLLAVDGLTNERKGDSGPDSWLPPSKAYRCTYVIRFTRIVSAYHLRLTPSMREAIVTQLDRCTAVEGSPSTIQVLPLPSPQSSIGSPVPYYANCAMARAAGRTPLHRGDPGYRTELDRDADGIACD
jgi:hypothetical protein